MATTLPKRKSGTKRRRGVRTPTGGDAPTVSPIQDPGVRATPGAFGENEAAALQGVAQDVGNIATRLQEQDQRLLAAQARIDAKQDNNRSLIMVDEFEQEETKIFDLLVSENKLGDADFNEQYGKAVDKAFDGILERSKFSNEEAKLDFQGQLLESRFKLGDDRGVENSTALEQRQIGIARAGLVKFQLSPERAGQGFNAVISGSRNLLQQKFGILLSEESERTLMNEVVIEQFTPRFSALIAGGDLNEARKLLNNINVTDAISSQQFRSSNQRIEIVEAKRIETSVANNALFQQEASRLGIPVEQLTASQKSALTVGSKSPAFKAQQTFELAKLEHGTDNPTAAQIKDTSRRAASIPDPLKSLREPILKASADQINKFRIEGRARATSDLQAINLGQAALGSERFKPGALANVRTGVAKLMELFQFSSETIEKFVGDATTSDLLNRSLSKLALGEADKISRVTNMALLLVKDVFGTIGSTGKGLDIVFEIAENVSNRDLELADAADAIALKIETGTVNNQDLLDYRAEVNKIMREFEIFPDELRAKFEKLKSETKKDVKPVPEFVPKTEEQKTLQSPPGSEILGFFEDGSASVLLDNGERKTISKEKIDAFNKFLAEESLPGESQGSPAPGTPRPAGATALGAVEGPEADLRVDGTPKGPGFRGALERPDGKISTEISVGVEIDGEETLIPTLVPTLTDEEVDTLLEMQPGRAQDIPGNIMEKAVDHALKRIDEGKSPFLEPGEAVELKTPTSEAKKPTELDTQGRKEVTPRTPPEVKKRIATKDKFNDAEAVAALSDEDFFRFISTTPASKRAANVNKVISERIRGGALQTRHSFIKEKEGFIAQARDIGDGTLTIGHGITSAAYKDLTGETLTTKTKITKPKAAELVSRFVDKFVKPELILIEKVKPLNANQKEAVTSLIFNVGVAAWKKSKARKALLNKDIKEFLVEAFDPVKGFLTSNKKFLKGLQNRRKDEKALFLKKVK